MPNSNKVKLFFADNLEKLYKNDKRRISKEDF